MNKNNLFAIGIPTINRADLLEQTLAKYQKDFPNTIIYVADNGYQHFRNIDELSNVKWIINSENLGVSGSWNQLIDKIFNTNNEPIPTHKYALILNDDVYFGKTENEVCEFLIQNEFPKFATTTITWCNFIIENQAWTEIGPFDEVIFPAYFEDNDYDYRIKLLEILVVKSDFLNPIQFKNSGSIEKNPSLNNNFLANKNYYIQKWGGEPGKETFKTPFNS